MFRLDTTALARMERAAQDSYVRELAAGLRQRAPDRFQALDEAELENAVAQTVERGREYGFLTRGALHGFVDIARTVGFYFDSDPRFDFATEHLRTDTERGEVERSIRLHRAFADYIDRVYGVEAIRLREAAGRLMALSPAQMQATIQTAPQVADNLLYAAQPEIHRQTGASAIGRLLDETAPRLAGLYGIEDGGDLVRLCLLAAVFGHGFDADPFLTWLNRPLHNATLSSHARVAAIESRVRKWSEAILSAEAAKV